LKLTLLALAALLVSGTFTCFAQGREVSVYTKTDVRDLAQRMERHSDEFKKHFEKSLDHSSLDGTDREDRLRHWAHDLEDTLDHFKDDYNHGRVHNVEQRANTLLAIAAGINRIMLYRPFDASTERDWDFLRSDLNALAVTYDLPALQSYRVRAQAAR
jgi:uncharacterized protein YeaO (DUF488 family)